MQGLAIGVDLTGLAHAIGIMHARGFCQAIQRCFRLGIALLHVPDQNDGAIEDCRNGVRHGKGFVHHFGVKQIAVEVVRNGINHDEGERPVLSPVPFQQVKKSLSPTASIRRAGRQIKFAATHHGDRDIVLFQVASRRDIAKVQVGCQRHFPFALFGRARQIQNGATGHGVFAPRMTGSDGHCPTHGDRGFCGVNSP